MLSKTTLQRLAAIVGPEYLLTTPEDLTCYSFDATPGNVRPEAVVLPASAQEISGVLKLANEEKIPVVPRGSGTNLSGGSVPIPGCLVLVTQRLNRIVEIDEDNLTATAQPGVVLADFHRAVEERGLFYPPDPASLSVATLGGTVAEGAGGPRGVKYGTTKDYVIGLEVVLATGEIIKTGGKTVKNVSGYDLTHLFVGSEGTLGVITEITVRLLPLPEAKRTCLAIFDTIEATAETVSAIIRQKIVPRTLELLDENSLRCIEAFRPTGLPLDAGAVLLIEVDGSATEIDRHLERVVKVCYEQGAREVKIARTEEESEALWTARRSHYAALTRAHPTVIIEDVTVPRPAIPKMVRFIKEAAKKYNLTIGLAAHAGDGNTHPDIMFDAREPGVMERVQKFSEEIFRAALALGGTLTGEHGIGTLKAPYLALQYGREGVEAMRRIKRALDPNYILNPGKVLPLE